MKVLLFAVVFVVVFLSIYGVMKLASKNTDARNIIYILAGIMIAIIGLLFVEVFRS